ncbi:hypothetical protein AMTR_s00032p00033250 [Amborella trichopoda]|uniref:Uncharacterized protein n=1 Tax=Amborella trichopoda TaxID=13333 RepID=U5CNN3_AMBTC|nr:hypothetical protein AMTR_s00032p00033250 [Amborella trichopoda]
MNDDDEELLEEVDGMNLGIGNYGLQFPEALMLIPELDDGEVLFDGVEEGIVGDVLEDVVLMQSPFAGENWDAL